MDPIDFPYRLSDHAREVIAERGIELRWIVLAVQQPVLVHDDEKDPDARHALVPVPEFGNRVLRVIYNPLVTPWRIVTAHFDRSMRGKL